MPLMSNLQKSLKIKVFIIFAIVIFHATTTDGKFVYRYNPMGGELKYLPNSPPYWDESTLGENVVRTEQI